MPVAAVVASGRNESVLYNAKSAERKRGEVMMM